MNVANLINVANLANVDNNKPGLPQRTRQAGQVFI